MRTNIDIDDELMEKARKLTNIKTKKTLVENALRLYIAVENQKKLSALWGNIKMDDSAFL
jgi:Arc/MetJ family transcription regulator